MTTNSSDGRPRLLLVDDDAQQVKALRRVLAHRGYDVDSAPDGERALEKLRGEPVDLVLLDVRMPGEDGFAVCRRIQETLPTPPTVLFVSARGETSARVRGLEAGAQDYILKPYRPDELEARIRVALRARSELEELAARVARDALTGLLNRGQLDERLTAAIAAAHRSGRPLCGLMLDIDRFKEVNDSLGHGAGDAVIVETARRIECAIRASDTAFRYGGEEFFVLVPDTSLAQAAVLAARLRTRIGSAPYVVETPAGVKRLRVTVSIGVAAWRPRTDPGSFLAAADEALYAAKTQGRDRAVVAAPGGSTESAPSAGEESANRSGT